MTPLYNLSKTKNEIGSFMIDPTKVTYIPMPLDGSNTLMPCPFTGPKMFCAGPNILSQPKNLTAFSVSSKTFVSADTKVRPFDNEAEKMRKINSRF